MLKELFNLFRFDEAISGMSRDFNTMLDLSQGLTRRAGRIFFEEETEGDDRAEISKSDIAVNKLEREIRRRVITHITIGCDASDVSYCLLLMSIVKDVERIGDYAKNLAEIHDIGGGSIPEDENGAELRGIRRTVEEAFATVREVFTSSDRRTAMELIQEGRRTNRRCDELIATVARSSYDASTTTSMALGARHFKRIQSHLLNILSGVVMPLHKLNYFDEQVLDREEVR